MDINSSSVILLCAAALILALIAVLVDRLNFPQTRFRPKRIKPAQRGPSRDRTGAHIVDVFEDESPPDQAKTVEETNP